MTAYQMISEQGTTVSIHVVPNGRVKYGVYAYLAGDAQTPVLATEANLADEKDRARVVAALPPSSQEEAPSMLTRLAAGVAVARVSGKSGAKRGDGGEVFPPIEPWPHAVDGPQLMHALCELVGRYMALPAHADVAIALWLVHTYAIAAADYTPYLLITSPVRECGKSTLLELLLHLAYRGQFTGGITAAALYRRIARLSPTMLLDELDTRLRGDSGEMLRGVLNTGFHRSGKVTICVGDEAEDRDFSTYCPKVLAGIGRVWDTVMSRSIPIPLQRASKEQLRRLEKVRGDRIGTVCLPYRRQLSSLADAIKDEITVADPVAPVELGARQSDVWRPLLAIADAIGGEWPARARDAAKALHGVAEDEGDYGLLLLEDVRSIFESHAVEGKLASAVLVEELVKREDRPWPEYRQDRPITKRGVASLLQRFGVKPKNIRLGGEVVKGYEYAQLLPAFSTYLAPPAEASATSATAPILTGPTPSTSSVADVALACPTPPTPGTCMFCGRTGLGELRCCKNGVHRPAAFTGALLTEHA
jgi:hypothetical protein